MKPTATSRKLRGGYYTPKPIADFLARWAVRSANAKVLEPSCGDGSLLASAVEALQRHGAGPAAIAEQIQGVEWEPREAAKAAERLESLGVPAPSRSIHIGDFFHYCEDHLARKGRFDAVIGNPPFIRYQHFIEEQRVLAFYLMRRAGLHPNRLTNAWVPFLVASTLMLDDLGRMAMIVPAELLQVNYAAELRKFLGNHYRRVTLITFKKLVFDAIQQEVVLVLGERDGEGASGIRTVELDGADDLVSYEHTEFSPIDLKPLDHSTEKWTRYFLDKDEIELLRAVRCHPDLKLAGELFRVDVGIVTGMNNFFVLTDKEVKEHSLGPFTQRIVGRSAHFQGLVFSEEHWKSNAEKEHPAHLLSLPDLPYNQLTDPVKHYITLGERRNLHAGYKCRIRKHWYVVPSIWVPHAFMLRQIHDHPKIIVNLADATCTDTIHRVKMLNGERPEAIAAAFLNSLTFAFTEVTGRSYGGGVLELEPNEAERLPIPLKYSERLDLHQLDKMIQRKGEIEEVLDITDGVLLRDGLNLDTKDMQRLRGIWKKLRDRRMGRR